MKLNDNREEVLETIEEGTPVTLMDWLSKHEPQKISEILSEIVEGEISDVDEKIVLTSAISILQGNKETDQEIFLAEDLKDE